MAETTDSEVDGLLVRMEYLAAKPKYMHSEADTAMTDAAAAIRKLRARTENWPDHPNGTVSIGGREMTVPASVAALVSEQHLENSQLRADLVTAYKKYNDALIHATKAEQYLNGERKMLTRKQITDAACDTIKDHGGLLVYELKKGDLFDGGNLVALLELFAQRLDRVESPDIVAVIDARMGDGWTRKLAEKLSNSTGATLPAQPLPESIAVPIGKTAQQSLADQPCASQSDNGALRKDAERWREYLSHHAADQRQAVTEAIDVHVAASRAK